MLNLVPDWAVHYEEFWLSMRGRNIWFIKLRYAAVIMLLIFLSISKYALGITFDPRQHSAIIIVTISILIYNILFHYIRRYLKHDAYKFNPLHLSLLQMISDLAALIILVYLTGSVESPLLLFFVFHMIVGSLILPGRIIYLLAVLVIAGVWAITIGEFYSVIPHNRVHGFLPVSLYKTLNYVLAINISFGFMVIMIVMIANRMSNQLLKREKQLLESIDKINSAEREKQKYVSGIVHEIKTPLSAVHSYLDLVLRKFLGPLDEIVEEKLIRARKRSLEAIDLINNVLKISKLKMEDSFIKEEVDIASILARAIKIARVNAEAKGVKLTLTSSRKQKTKVEGDQLLIQIAFSNIIGNAIKYNNMEGIVDINVGEEKDNLVVTVCDNGVGIPKEEIDKVFTDFFRGSNIRKSNPEGSGLGLSVVKQIVERHGGTINIQSPSPLATSKCPGTCVKITLPFLKK